MEIEQNISAQSISIMYIQIQNFGYKLRIQLWSL